MKLDKTTVVAVTGASSGIGQELAFQFAAKGCAVALAARRGDLVEAHAAKIRASGGRAIAAACDVSRREDVERFFERIAAEFGRLDVAVHNAGISPAMGTLLENAEEDFRRTLEVNLMGCFYGTRAAAPLMEKSGGGVMMYVSSIMGKRGAPRSAAYCSSKFALQGFTESIRPELKLKNIRVITLCPPGVDTPFFEVNGKPGLRRYRLHPVEKIAREMIRACEKEKREVLLTFDAKAIFWANTLFPRIVDRLAVMVKGV